MRKVITHIQNKFIESAIVNLSSEMSFVRTNLLVFDVHHFMLALSREKTLPKYRNIIVIYSNELEVFILQSVCDISFYALDLRANDIFDFFKGGKVFKKIKPFTEREDSVRMRVFLLILRGWDDDRICHTLILTMKKLKEYKSQLTYLFFEKRRNLFYLTLNGFLQCDALAA
ncbi:hypothetical protein PUG42_10735 [Erwiniaceae bacterium L1_54_3]|nr:hypothetical protein [Erwiniaceae bacterium L1_54_3]